MIIGMSAEEHSLPRHTGLSGTRERGFNDNKQEMLRLENQRLEVGKQRLENRGWRSRD